MLVAITQRNELNRHKESIDSLENKYINYLESFGIKLLIIPNVTENLNFYFDLFPIEGIILSGGNDINPLLYNKKYQNEMSISKKRDKIEFRLIEIAIEKKIPLLGICRGMQIINVFFKGEICLLNGHPPAKNHKINFLEFKEKFDNEVIVNSYHNYGIKKKQLSEILKPLAESKEGNIEGFYHPNLPIIGIQWHPERISPNEEINKKIISTFMNNDLL